MTAAWYTPGNSFVREPQRCESRAAFAARNVEQLEPRWGTFEISQGLSWR